MSHRFTLLLCVASLLMAAGACRGKVGRPSLPSAVGGSVQPNPQPSGPVDLDVDTDRNGTVDNTTAEDGGEDSWRMSGGAVFYYNIDDDDNNDVEDGNDALVNGTADQDDLSRMVVRQNTGAPAGGQAVLTITSAAAVGNIRVFRNNAGTWTPVINGTASATFPSDDLRTGAVEFGIEASKRTSVTWDGFVTFTLDVKNASGQSVGTDTVRLRCAPWLMATNLWSVDELHVVGLGAANQPFRTDLQRACTGLGIRYREANGATYGQDRWIQDSSEAGMIYVPKSGSPRRRVDSVLQCARRRPVDVFCRNELWARDFDFIRDFGTTTTSLNYGGNLEIIPPHTAPNGRRYAWGRVLVGGGTGAPIGGGAAVTRDMDLVYRQYFDSLKIHGNHLKVSTEWLAVGHNDEYMQFIPAPAKARGWVAVLASPDLARQVLQRVQTAGGGGLAVFQGRRSATTVAAVLGNAARMTYNQEVQTKMNTVRQQLKSEIGLTDAEIIDVPVLFESTGGFGSAAYNPGVANMVTLINAQGQIHLVVPDPEGPDQPTDQWQAETLTRLRALGTAAKPVQVTFTDVFTSYHELLGEAHCGTNWIRTAPADHWWDKPSAEQ